MCPRCGIEITDLREWAKNGHKHDGCKGSPAARLSGELKALRAELEAARKVIDTARPLSGQNNDCSFMLAEAIAEYDAVTKGGQQASASNKDACNHKWVNMDGTPLCRKCASVMDLPMNTVGKVPATKKAGEK
jgi:hypothetical protein